MIAIIDDDQIVREAIGNLVQSLGYEVAIFESAEQFLAASRLTETSCLIVDVQLPGLSGLDLQRRLGMDGHCPLAIFVTASADMFRQRAMNGGAVGFLSKPFEEAALISCLETALQPRQHAPKWTQLLGCVRRRVRSAAAAGSLF
jgi:FixJ family two-component response regulator